MTKKKPQRGRPVKDAKDKRSAVLFIKLTPEEKRIFRKVSKTPSVWVRDVALAEAKRQLGES